ncbi:Regulatory protein AtoC [BD1-7 clade bacterium]|uniref:Regulatory protein AtoC n=1 Tax=BD1-7 clade bacterium TaxID=2029982 RepID=A0A5S9N5L9_9GAMM|nr:Regulatory protein AtoC [BD1-7 clade bacterium]CAA0085151.1 Regulatory protein AtoC [BD1-7 clade bacterium]
MIRILTVEDEVIIRTALKRLLEKNGYQVDEAGSVKEALDSYDLGDFDLIISDLRLPGAPGTDLIAKSGDTPVLIMTSYASMRSAVDSMKMGAVDYIAKPFDHEEMLNTVQRITELHQLHREDDIIEISDTTFIELPKMVGSCAPMKRVYKHVKKSAPTDCNILIHGETGTGKELIARAIHQLSHRTNREVICVNCAAIPETLIESELFGYEKGAFTGANTNRIGLIEAANHGTLFLDEIGELPLEAQARLLRFLQEGEIRRIGSVETQEVDVRVIAATHRNLKALSEKGEFRQDLFYRLNVMQITLPPLRDRGKDVLEIASNFLQKICDKMNKPEAHFTPKAIQALTTYHWPGNIRELENVVERAVILSDSKEIDYDLFDIDMELVQLETLDGDMEVSAARAANNTLKDSNEEGLSLEDYFQRFILEHQDQMSETDLARKLGVSRKCLWERRQRLGIPRKKAKTSGA